jgi:hypothetical protein
MKTMSFPVCVPREGKQPLLFAQQANGKSGRRAQKHAQNWIQYSIPQNSGQQIRDVGKGRRITGSITENSNSYCFDGKLPMLFKQGTKLELEMLTHS